MSERKALEDLWRQRLTDASRRLETAQLHLREFLCDNPPNGFYDRDSRCAYRQAIKDDILALREYARVLRIYKSLRVHGVLPDEEGLAKEVGAQG